MDLVSIIESSIINLPESYNRSGINAVILHIKRAEKYWEMAKECNDDVMFTDVVYRTNQAFEGALKEAYSILAGKDPSKETPYKIERYLETSNVLKERLINALTNYRTEWRNSSTHDYKLFFTEHEALLAIASVSTLCIILMEQIITKANENVEKERSKHLSEEVLSKIDSYEQLPFHEKVYSILAKSYEYIELPIRQNPLRESEYLGMLAGFLEAVKEDLAIDIDVKIDDISNKRADMIITSDDGHKVLLEVKSARTMRNYRHNAENQVMNYLDLTGIDNGALMIFDETAQGGTWSTQTSMFPNEPVVSQILPLYH